MSRYRPRIVASSPSPRTRLSSRLRTVREVDVDAVGVDEDGDDDGGGNRDGNGGAYVFESSPSDVGKRRYHSFGNARPATVYLSHLCR